MMGAIIQSRPHSRSEDNRVIRLWEVDASIVFDQHLSALLPFVPVLRGGQELPIITRAVQLLRQDEMVLRMFEHRFGKSDLALVQHIRTLNSEQFDQLMDVLLDATERAVVIAFVKQCTATSSAKNLR